MKSKIKLTNKIERFFLKIGIILFNPKLKVRAFTAPWKTIYVINEKDLKNKKLIKHEKEHLAQISRDGKIKFTVKYLYYHLKYGYYNNPYEVKARNVSKNINFKK